MDRLTEHHVDKNKGAYMVCSESCQMESCDECEKLDEVVDRLAAYEDTGWTPEEIKTMHNELCLNCGNYKDAHLGACNGCRWRKKEST